MSMIKQKQQAHRLLGLASVVLGSSLLLTACGGGDHQVKAVDKVEEAAEMAKANAPEPEVLEFDDSEVPVTTEDGAATDESATEDSAEAADDAQEAADAEETETATADVDAEVTAETEETVAAE